MLTVNVVGAGDGTVASNPSAIDTSSSQSASFLSNTVVTLSAFPRGPDAAGGPFTAAMGDSLLLDASASSAGTAFVGWSGDAFGNSSFSLTMDSDRSVTASFADLSTFQYAWDLNNDLVFEYTSASPSFTVPAAALAPLGVGMFPMNIRVTNEFGAQDIARTTLPITQAAVPEPSS